MKCLTAMVQTKLNILLFLRCLMSCNNICALPNRIENFAATTEGNAIICDYVAKYEPVTRLRPSMLHNKIIKYMLTFAPAVTSSAFANCGFFTLNNLHTSPFTLFLSKFFSGSL